MNTIAKTGLFIFFLLSSFAILAQQKSIYFTELHGEFLGNLTVNQSGVLTKVGSLGAGVQVSRGKEHFSSTVSYNYRRVNLKELQIPGAEKVNIHEFYLGLRYFPMRPTFMFGNTALRLTAGAQYGLDLDSNWRSLLFAGMVVTPIRAITGLSVNVVYRPKAIPSSGYLLEPSWAIRAALLIGPTPK